MVDSTFVAIFTWTQDSTIVKAPTFVAGTDSDSQWAHAETIQSN